MGSAYLFVGESNVGRFESEAFVSALLNEQLLRYGRQLDPIVNEIDLLEQRILRDRVDEDKLIRQLVAINQRITRLRLLRQEGVGASRLRRSDPSWRTPSSSPPSPPAEA